MGSARLAMNHKWFSFPILAVVSICAGSASGQVWTIGAKDIHQETQGYVERFADGPPNCAIGVDCTCSPDVIIGNEPLVDALTTEHANDIFDEDVAACPDLSGNSFAQSTLMQNLCPLRAGGLSHVEMDGAGTGVVTIEWDLISKGFNNCNLDGLGCPGMSPDVDNDNVVEYIAEGYASQTVLIEFIPEGLPDGTAVEVYYAWQQFAFNNYKPECDIIGDAECPPPPDSDDPAGVWGELAIDGNTQFNGQFDVMDQFALLNDTVSGSFTATAGIPVTIEITGEAVARVAEPGYPGPFHAFSEDSAQVAFQGQLTLGFTPGVPCPEPEVDFSVDIGSDVELSDTQGGSTEMFDPGDTYLWKGAVPPAALDGQRDDNQIFGGQDYQPDPDVLLLPAPTCAEQDVDTISADWFDLDAHDAVDFDPSVFIPANAPLPAPIERFDSACVHSIKHLLVSFDDDGAAHYTGNQWSCEVPAASGAPVFPPVFPPPEPFGTTQRKDEIVGVSLVRNPAGGSYFLGAEFPSGDEVDLHEGLVPNPVTAQEENDDDTDSLDAFGDPAVCDTWLFSPDHEATGRDTALNNAPPLDPGGIYQVLPGAGGLVKIIDEQIHLGLNEDTDIDAFEFAWYWYCDALIEVEQLVLLFSVDDDDPLTIGVDESGGLDPRVIYVSTMTGDSAALMEEPLSGDIDALTVWCAPVIASAPTSCPQDLNGDGIVDILDLLIVLASWGPCAGCPADFDGDGEVGISDLLPVLANWGPCPV